VTTPAPLPPPTLPPMPGPILSGLSTPSAPAHAAAEAGRLAIFHGYMGVFVVAFLVTLFATPIMRRLAISHGVIDRPSVARKIHRIPIAYLGGVGVYLGLLGGILFAYAAPFHGLIEHHPSQRVDAGMPGAVPMSILLGMTVVMLCGLIDDVVGIDPRAKIAGQLFAAAALATQDIGVKVAGGVIMPLANAVGLGSTQIGPNQWTVLLTIPLPGSIFGFTEIPIDLVYWIGTAVIAVCVVGACNASNLIDGLDGLLSGTTAIAAIGLLMIALMLALVDDGPLDGARIVLCLALLGACLGFLPHNFNPATIFLGDAGSLLLGFVVIVIVLSLGDTGRTNLVLAGLVIYAIPIIDTTLAIIRRKVAGKKISDADDQHLHHMLKRSLGVKGAVFVLYGIAASFAVLGVVLAEGRARVTFALTMVLAAFIGVQAFKVARRDALERQTVEAEAARAAKSSVPAAASVPPPASAAVQPNGEHAEPNPVAGATNA
jgi:UDP-GlcNAc:undecaprenyl-phosphate/decaprenyl-phosphate GlcNAc-1-phosphate transferase